MHIAYITFLQQLTHFVTQQPGQQPVTRRAEGKHRMININDVCANEHSKIANLNPAKNFDDPSTLYLYTWYEIVYFTTCLVWTTFLGTLYHVAYCV